MHCIKGISAISMTVPRILRYESSMHWALPLVERALHAGVLMMQFHRTIFSLEEEVWR